MFKQQSSLAACVCVLEVLWSLLSVAGGGREELFTCMEEVCVCCVMFSCSTRCRKSRVRPVFMEIGTCALAADSYQELSALYYSVQGQCEIHLRPARSVRTMSLMSEQVTLHYFKISLHAWCIFFFSETLYSMFPLLHKQLDEGVFAIRLLLLKLFVR